MSTHGDLYGDLSIQRALCYANPEKGDFRPFGQVYPEKSDLW